MREWECSSGQSKIDRKNIHRRSYKCLERDYAELDDIFTSSWYVTKPVSLL
jgi:hypothetical protein